MSYILDALQRAEAERERGHVPGLNSQIVPPPTPKGRSVRRQRPARNALAGAAVAALVIAAGLWWWLGQDGETRVAEPAPVPAAPPPVAAVTTLPPAPSPAAPAPVPEPVQPILAPPRVEPAPKKPQASNPAALPQPPAASPPANAPAGAVTPVPAATAKAPSAAAPPPAATAATTPDANVAPVRSFAELSPEARAQLPAVNVSGSTYSRNPALRMLIVNGKVLQEGQEISPGFKLETTGQRSAVLNHNGVRYSIGY